MSGRREDSLYGGFDPDKFVEAVDDFICSVCTKVLREPHLTACCGQHYCSSCLGHWSKTQHKPTRCPYCRQSNFRHILDRKMERRIKSLHVLCVHSEDGCQWKGELRNLKDHLQFRLDDGCGYIEIACSNNCGALLRQKDKQEHMEKECPLRTYQCEHCGTRGIYKDITTQHYVMCSKYPLQCPKGCPTVVKRCDLEAHKNKCPLEEVVCPYSSYVGCDAAILRKDLDDHLTRHGKQHISEMSTKLADCERDVNKVQEELVRISARVNKTKARIDETNEKVEELQNSLSEMRTKLVSSKRELQQELENTNAEVEETNERVEELQKTLRKVSAELVSSKREMQRELATTNARVEGTNERVSNFSEMSTELASSQRDVQWELTNTNARMEATNERVEELQNNMSEVSTKLVSSEREMQWELAYTNAQVEKTNERMNRTNARMEELRIYIYCACCLLVIVVILLVALHIKLFSYIKKEEL